MNHQAYSQVVEMRGTALTLGIIGVAAVVTAGLMILLGSSDLRTPSVGVLVRVGAILLAVSLVLPSIRRPSIITIIVIGSVLLLVMMRPALIWAALIGWVVWLVMNRHAVAASVAVGKDQSTAESDS